MKIFNQILNFIKWYLLKLWEIRRNTFPLIGLGLPIFVFCLTALIQPISFSISPTTTNRFLNLISIVILFNNANSQVASWIGMLLGGGLIIKGLSLIDTKIRSIARFAICGIDQFAMDFPNNVISKAESYITREPIILGFDNSNLKVAISDLNCERYYIQKHHLINGIEKIYLVGLARIPFLVAYGSCFRNSGLMIAYADKMHNSNSWGLLENPPENIEINCTNVDTVQPNSDGQIGIVISFTTEITKEQLPEFIKESVVFINPTIQKAHNLIKNKDDLNRITMEIKEVITKLSKKCREVHFFLSVQTVVAIDLGRRFQGGLHKNWIVHNYTPRVGYDWALRIGENEVSEYSSNN